MYATLLLKPLLCTYIWLLYSNPNWAARIFWTECAVPLSQYILPQIKELIYHGIHESY